MFVSLSTVAWLVIGALCAAVLLADLAKFTSFASTGSTTPAADTTTPAADTTVIGFTNTDPPAPVGGYAPHPINSPGRHVVAAPVAPVAPVAA